MTVRLKHHRLIGCALGLQSILILSACAAFVPGQEPYAGVAAAALDCALPEGPVAVAISARSNAPSPEVTPKVRAVIDHALETESHVAVLDTDGAPNIRQEGDLLVNAKNAQAQEQQREELSRQVAEVLSSVRADAPQADPLAALDTAARTVHAIAPKGTVILVDNGLQTSGALRYQSEDLLLASGSDVVAHLRSMGQLPDLGGLTVVLIGLGDTAPPQQRLDSASRNRLVEHWSGIAEAAGAACVEVDTQPLTDPVPPGLPAVATVPVLPPPKPALDVTQPVALREDVVGFADSSARLRDPTRARAGLKNIAHEIITRHHRVTLVGTTATAGTANGRRTLSLRRAEAVKQLLIELGVSPAYITTRGVGVNHPQHVDDIDAHGNLVPKFAVRNRAVFVVVDQ